MSVLIFLRYLIYEYHCRCSVRYELELLRNQHESHKSKFGYIEGKTHICVLSPFLGKKGIFLIVKTLDIANLDLLRVFPYGLKVSPENSTRNYTTVMHNLLQFWLIWPLSLYITIKLGGV